MIPAPEFASCFPEGPFPGPVIRVVKTVILKWQVCQGPGVIGSVLGLVGLLSVCRDRTRKLSATSI